MKSGAWGSALILAMACLRVPTTSVLAGLLKPMWLSLICTQFKPPIMLSAGGGVGGDKMLRGMQASTDVPQHSRAAPGHAFQEAAAVHAVAGVVVFDVVGI